MNSFEWTDRKGTVHHLDSPQLIEIEAEAISMEIDRALKDMASANTEEKASSRLEIGDRMVRLQQLNADAERWNALARSTIKDEAASFVQLISALTKEAETAMIVSVLHDEHERLMMDVSNRDALLSGKMTNAQQMAIRRSKMEPKPEADATRDEAQKWLQRDPAFYRPRTDEGGWFEWQDAEGVTHRIVSPLRIEKEIASIVHGLKKLLPALSQQASIDEAAHALETGGGATDRLFVLQTDLHRFILEAGAREDEQWDTWEREWTKSRRGK